MEIAAPFSTADRQGYGTFDCCALAIRLEQLLHFAEFGTAEVDIDDLAAVQFSRRVLIGAAARSTGTLTNNLPARSLISGAADGFAGL